jgi:hypothetical protein
MSNSHARRHLRGYALLLICLGLATLLPGKPAAALGSVPQSIDNNQSDFADGVFQRVSLGSDQSSITAATGEEDDLPGVVQLAPAGVLDLWNQLGTLNEPVSGAGVTALGGRIFVIGGKPSSTINATDKVYSTTVDPQTGTLAPWKGSTLPSVKAIYDDDTQQINSNCVTATSKRNRPGVASLQTGTNTGYIYVIGGVLDIAGCYQLSSPTVLRAAVAANGTISWTDLGTTPSMRMPSPLEPIDDGTQSARTLGVDGAAVTIAHVRGNDGLNHYYLYVIGGKSSYVAGFSADIPDSLEERVLRTVYYTEINSSTGNFVYPGPGTSSKVWKRDTADIGLVNPPTNKGGLWNAAVTTVNATSGSLLKASIFLSGGAHDLNKTSGVQDPTSPDSFVYRADVGANGALTWAAGTNTVGSEQVGLAGRQGMASLAYNNKLYMIGGTTSKDATGAKDTVPTAFLDDNLNVIKYDENTNTFFVGTTDKVLNTNVSDQGRTNIGAVLVRAEPPPGTINGTLNSAWAFVIGGDNHLGTPTNTIYRGRIGGSDEASAVKRAPDGWYYSGVIKSSFEIANGSSTTNEQARLIAIHWAADIDRTSGSPDADIELQFRKKITASGNCTGADAFQDSDAWSAIADGFANNALHTKTATTGTLYNKADMATVFGSSNTNASCIQYRAHLTQDATNSGVFDPASTPKLLSIYIEKEIAIKPDITIPAGGFDVITTADSRLSSLRMTIQNLSPDGASKTLSVEKWLALNGLNPHGNFYVNLCITKSADPKVAAPALTLPSPSANFVNTGNNKTLCPYYAAIYSAEMGVGASVDLTKSTVPATYGGGSRWYSNTNGAAVTDIKSAFSKLAQYRIGLVLDTTVNVAEGDVGEANNLSSIVSFTIAGTPVNRVMLPFVRR